MVEVWRGEGWSIRAIAAEPIVIGEVVALDATTGYARTGAVAYADRIMGVAMGGDFVGKTGQTEGIIASGNAVSIGTKGKFTVTAGEAIDAGIGLRSGNSGTVLENDSSDAGVYKLIGSAVDYAAASGTEIEIVI